MERKGVRKGTVNKYLKVFNEIKYRCDNKLRFSFRYISMEYKVSNAISTFLIKKGIVWKTAYNLHTWNEKIPVTNKLILSFLNDVHEINKKIRENQEPQQTKISFKGQPHYIKDAKEGTVTIVPQGKEKEYIENYRTKRNTKQKPEPQEIGLIRRFMKWIY
jgi:hypothetical protein